MSNCTLLDNVTLIKPFLSASQLKVLVDNARFSEEKEFFKEAIQNVVDTIAVLPGTGETDGQGDKAIIHLHYFLGSADWYITEKDSGSPDDEEQGVQQEAFGYVDLGIGMGGELGYISIQELIDNGVELDLHWEPKTIGEVKASN